MMNKRAGPMAPGLCKINNTKCHTHRILTKVKMLIVWSNPVRSLNQKLLKIEANC